MKQQKNTRPRTGTGQMLVSILLAGALAVVGLTPMQLRRSGAQVLQVEPVAMVHPAGTLEKEQTPSKNGRPAAQLPQIPAEELVEQPEQMPAETPAELTTEEAEPIRTPAPTPAPTPEPIPTVDAEEEAPAEQPAAEEAPEAAPENEEENGWPLPLKRTNSERAAEDMERVVKSPEDTGWEIEFDEDGVATITLNGEEVVLMTPEQAETVMNFCAVLPSEEEENCLRWLLQWIFGSKKPVERSGWYKENGKEYYYDPVTHVPVTGLRTVEDKVCYFDENGVKQNVTLGIDVSKYEPQIDWKKVREAGVDFVILRIGYRGYGTGVMVLDEKFEQHYRGAREAGLKIGAYFFTQAITPEEAAEEAAACDYVLDYFNFTLDLPLYIDSEYSTSKKTGRADYLTQQQRTDCVVAFCEQAKADGYVPGVYASENWFKKQLDLSRLKKYSIWNAHYGVNKTGMACDIWQGSSSGKLSAIPNVTVDLNVSFMK